MPGGRTPVILSAAKDLVVVAFPYEILRCAQDDDFFVNCFLKDRVGERYSFGRWNSPELSQDCFKIVHRSTANRSRM